MTSGLEIGRAEVHSLAEELYMQAQGYKIDPGDPNFHNQLSTLDQFLMEQHKEIFGPYLESYSTPPDTLIATTPTPDQPLKVIFDNRREEHRGLKVLEHWWGNRDWFLRLEVLDKAGYHRLNCVEISHFSFSSDPVIFSPPDEYYGKPNIPSGVLPTAFLVVT